MLFQLQCQLNALNAYLYVLSVHHLCHAACVIDIHNLGYTSPEGGVSLQFWLPIGLKSIMYLGELDLV